MALCLEGTGLALCVTKDMKHIKPIRRKPCDYQWKVHRVPLWSLSFGTDRITNILLLNFILILLLRVFGT